jgi:predicted membrane channel-forming protein YqfA (hemolysin III family)
MDWYTLAKWLHVTFAIIWLGGALIMVFLGAAADRARDDNDMVWIVRKVSWCAERVFVAASILTVVFGLITVWLGNLWSHLWVILGLIGIAATIGMGIGVLTPRSKRAEAGFAAGGATPAVIAQCREILAVAKFDMVLLFTIVADMVLKPGWNDLGSWVTIAIFALVIAAAGYVFLMPTLRPKAAAAAS